jgi:hypothetical protein
MEASGARWSDPYLCGLALGLVMLAAFATCGRGLGASGAFSTVAAAGVAAIAPERARSHPVHAAYLETPPQRDWLVLELLGVTVGAAVSARRAGRMRVELARGAGCGRARRVLLALVGGLLMGLGARLARGCTSGLALSGGAVLSVGGWTFLLVAFAAAHLASLGLKKAWS